MITPQQVRDHKQLLAEAAKLEQLRDQPNEAEIQWADACEQVIDHRLLTGETRIWTTCLDAVRPRPSLKPEFVLLLLKHKYDSHWVITKRVTYEDGEQCEFLEFKEI